MEKKARCERNLRLLIVEDDESQLRTLTSIMEEEGFDVVGCSTASEALEHLGRLEAGVVVLDLRLPDLSGTQLLERLATATERIRVVINTAYSSFESAKDALNLGAFAYVEKAGDPQELLRHVHRAFQASLRSYADQLETAVAERTRELRQANESLTEEITERKKLEDRLSAIIYKSPIATAVGRSDGSIISFNEALETLIGYKKSEISDVADWTNKLYPDKEYREFVLKNIQQALDGEEQDCTEFTITCKDGSTKIADFHTSFFKGGLVIQTVDITERKRAEERIRVFSDAIASAFDCFLLTDEKGNITYANESACKTFGYTPEEFLKLHITKLDTDPEFAKKITQEVTAKGKWSGEVINIRKNMEKFPSLLSAFIIKDEKGKPKGSMAILKDITERKKVEDELARSEKQFRDIFEHTAVGVYRTTPDGRILMANPALMRMLGYSSFDELARRNLEEEGYEPEYPRSVFIEKIEKEGKVIKRESVWTRLDGTRLVVIENARAVRDEHGNTLYYEGTADNITERKEAEEEARRHQSELAHMSRLGTIGQMASELAHELNQPLCATLTHLEGCLKMVKSGSLDTDKVLKKLETATKQIDQAGAIVSRVKGFAMKGKIKRSTVFINDVVREAASFSEIEMRNNHIATELNLGRKIRPVLANPIQIEQVILNLIQNAIEAMKDIPNNHRKLTISTIMLDDAVEVAVRDAGKGIEKDNAENIFDSFVTTKSQGLGIGLSISQSIIESHGGQIYFKDNSDHGVTFCFTLPLQPKAEKV